MRMPWTREPEYADPQVRLEPREVAAPPLAADDDAALQVQVVDWAEKPADLVAAKAAAENGEWTRPRRLLAESGKPFAENRMPALDKGLPWTDQAPRTPGVYWWATASTNEVRQCKVIEYGGRMCVQQRGAGDASTFLSVEILGRWWAGPEVLPEHVELSQVVLS